MMCNRRLPSLLNKVYKGLQASRRCIAVDYTYKNYNVEPRSDLTKVSTEDIEYFENLLPNRVVTDPDELYPHNKDWLNLNRGMSPVMVQPETTIEVSQIMKYCHEKSIPVCVQGGNTGLVGGSVPIFDEVILSMSRMNEIREIDTTAGTVECQAGVILENLDNELAQHGLMVPLDMGAAGSCHIGGNVSTNAGGVRYLRYGSLHGNVLGVEAVLADGSILDCLSSMKKDNTGYDLKQLFIGSEGTLGIVTTVSMLTPQRPLAKNVAFLGVNSFQNVKEAFIKARYQLSEILSAFEFMDNECMSSVCMNLSHKNPIGSHPFYILVETSGSNSAHDEEKLGAFLNNVMETGVAVDGTVANDIQQMNEIWKMRRNITEALLFDGNGCFKFDFSLPVDTMYQLVSIMREQFSDKTNRIVGYGHFGDGNLHLNVISPTNDREFLSEVQDVIFKYVSDHEGSVSAEHGIGFMFKDYMHHSRSPEAIDLMRKMKTLFDPKGILNPYKMIPSS